MTQFRNAGIALIAVTAMTAGFWLSSLVSDPNRKDKTGNHIGNQPIQGVILPVARKIAVPELYKDDGSAFINSDLQGHWTLMFFGYTHCPDICPMTLNLLVQARKHFSKEFPKIEFPEVMLVSVDPERDTVEILNEYIKYFDSTFTGITGKPELIKALTLQLSVVYMQMPTSESQDSGSEDNYTVDHSSSILLFNPQGKLHAFLNPPHSVKSIVDSVRTVTEMY